MRWTILALVFILVGCGSDAESQSTTLCETICGFAGQCAVESKTAFSELECFNICTVNWQKVETIGCLEVCESEFQCIYEKLGETSCLVKAVRGAADICEPEKNGCFECLDDESVDISLDEFTFSGVFEAIDQGCVDYCGIYELCGYGNKDECLNSCIKMIENTESTYYHNLQVSIDCAEKNKNSCEGYNSCLRNP